MGHPSHAPVLSTKSNVHCPSKEICCSHGLLARLVLVNCRRKKNSRLVKVVIVVMVFMVVVMLMPLHHLSQPSFIQQKAGQVPHMLFLHSRSS